MGSHTMSTDGLAEGGWALPERYTEMTPTEQQAAIRAAILAYITEHGAAAKSVLKREIRPPRAETFQKALDYLATTQQIYVDEATGSRDPTYYSNGRLAHPTGQRFINLGRYQYVIQAFDDRLAGKALTLTQFAILPSGAKKPVGGIRFDWVDGEQIATELLRAVRGLMGTTGLVQPERRASDSLEGM